MTDVVKTTIDRYENRVEYYQSEVVALTKALNRMTRLCDIATNHIAEPTMSIEVLKESNEILSTLKNDTGFDLRAAQKRGKK